MSANIVSAIVRCDDGLILTLYIQPKASRDAIIGLHGDALKIAITAPPIDGKANLHLQNYLADQFHVTKNQVQLEKGRRGRHKQIRILHPQHIPPALVALLPD